MVSSLYWLRVASAPGRLHTLHTLRTSVGCISTSCVNRNGYDTVIVGAGSAGCVLANRLSEDDGRRILVLEAGPPDNQWDFRIHMPAALMYNLMDDRYNWFYHTVPQKNMNNRVMYWPRGRVWGGSSSLNAMVYIRGHPFDYDRWESEGADGWSYSRCLPYFRKAQSHQLGSNAYRGGSGPLHVSRGTGNNPLHKAFIEAAQQAGYPYTSDVNGYQQEGVGWYEMTIHKGKRWSASQAYLRPALKRPNLSIKSSVLVRRVLLEGTKAVGVEYEEKGTIHKVYADSDVILCGGAINSPQLLQLSGIGPADHLKDVGVTPHINLPGVGANLQDHIDLYIQQKCTQPITLYNAQWKFPHRMIRIGAEWLGFQTGDGATTHLESGGFIRSDPGQRHANIQYHFLPSTVYDHGRIAGPCHAFQAHVGTMRDRSRGTIRLASPDPKAHPLIDPAYLSHPTDLSEAVTSIRLTREIFAQRAFDPFRGDELQPGSDCQTDKQLEEFVRQKGDSTYHPSCTCKMGSDSDPLAVTDSEGRVRGVEKLRVVDASIMPSVITGNLNGPTIMLAEKCADSIRGREPLPASNAPVWTPTHPEKQREAPSFHMK